MEIPGKLYFKIGEVSQITGIKPYVLRYWETEFSAIRPVKSKTNQRVYQRKDIETVLLIKKLLYEEKFTIEGARARIKELRGVKEEETEVTIHGVDESEIRGKLETIREKVADLLKILE